MAKKSDTEQSGKSGGRLILDVALHGQAGGEAVPDLALYAVGRDGKVSEKLASVRNSKLEINAEIARKFPTIAIGPDGDDPGDIEPQALMQFRSAEALPMWQQLDRIDIPRRIWEPLLRFTVCVSGRVRVCRPRFLVGPIARSTLPSVSLGVSAAVASAVGTRAGPLGPAALTPLLPLRCDPICNGVVEIYERECCCRRPIIIIDPPWWVDDICRRLGIDCPPQPIPRPDPIPDPFPDPRPGPFPGPRPGPDPLPFDTALLPRHAARSIALREASIDAAAAAPVSERLLRDLSTIRQLPGREASAYLDARPYLRWLWCTCSQRKVGQAVVRPDGSFDFCYRRLPRLLMPGQRCTYVYAYRVKQWIDNQWVTIYDGVAGHDYHDADELADLVSRHPQARPCPEPSDPPVEHDTPFVMLERIGGTETHRMESPLQQAELGINQVLADNAGLVDAPTNRPWGDVLSLRLFFTESMRGLGARYYRISKVRANAQGNPVVGATPAPLNNPLSWRRIEFVAGLPVVTSDNLGPNSLTDGNGDVQNALYRIPYVADGNWLSNQYHQWWDTQDEAGARYLLVVEVFDAAGNRIKPTGSTGVGTPLGFHFLHWRGDATTFDLVHYAALTHLFWTDNRACFGNIEDLRSNGVPSSDECQFLTQVANPLAPAPRFSVGYRAFHVGGPAGETFMQSYTMFWRRGLSGIPAGMSHAQTVLAGDTANAPPTLAAGSPAVSNSHTFAHMLGAHAKCAFAVNLRVYAKHTNGSRRLSEYDVWDQAAFALELLPPSP